MPNDDRPGIIQLSPSDNIVVATRPLEVGTAIDVDGRPVVLSDHIPLGHKLAIVGIEAGEPVRKYGQIIGQATRPITAGQWVHTHNLALHEFERDYASARHIPADPTPITDRTFLGYRRSSGKAGTRNYIAVISTVNCSASVSKYIARRFGACRSGRIRQRRRRSRVHACGRLWTAVWWHRSSVAQPRAGRHRSASQYRSLSASRFGMRTSRNEVFVRPGKAGADCGSAAQQ